jgi:hypothetical protein
VVNDLASNEISNQKASWINGGISPRLSAGKRSIRGNSIIQILRTDRAPSGLSSGEACASALFLEYLTFLLAGALIFPCFSPRPLNHPLSALNYTGAAGQLRPVIAHEDLVSLGACGNQHDSDEARCISPVLRVKLAVGT